MISVVEPKPRKRRVAFEPILLAPSVQKYFANPWTHERLLQDKVRLEAFRKAIRETVKPGDVVMDIGAGTGILSQYAIEAGAKKVYLIEENANILRIAKERLSRYLMGVQLKFIERRSTDIATDEISEKVDVIVSETIGSLGINEGILHTMNDAKRFLKINGVIIPQKISIFMSLYTMPECEEVPFLGLSVSRCPKPGMKLTRPIKIVEYDFNKYVPLHAIKTVKVNSQFPVHQGVCYWFEARLSSTYLISNSPKHPATSWGFVFSNGRDLCVPFNLTFMFDQERRNKLDMKFVYSSEDEAPVNLSYEQSLVDNSTYKRNFQTKQGGITK